MTILKINTDAIEDLAVTNAKLAAGAAVANIGAGGITATQLASDSVTTAKILSGNVTPAKLSQPLTAMTVQASTSGTSRDFTSIPSWARKIRAMLSGVSLSGTALIRFQLGTAGGIVSTGYLGAGSVISAGSATVNQTAGFDIYTNVPNATYVYHGLIDFSLLDATNNVWVASGVFATSSVAWTHTTAGVITLSGTLTQLRVTTSNGTDTFDAGSINVLYE